MMKKGEDEVEKISEFAKSLSLKTKLPDDFDYKEELRKILMEKYK